MIQITLANVDTFHFFFKLTLFSYWTLAASYIPNHVNHLISVNICQGEKNINILRNKVNIIY